MSDALIEELRVRFRESTRTRVATMRSLLEAIETNPQNADAIGELMRHFHFFAGMGTTCGFPAVSSIADEGEGMLIELINSGTAPRTEDVAVWRDLAVSIEIEVRVEPD